MFYPMIVPQYIYTGPFGLCKNHLTRQEMWCTVFRNTRNFMMTPEFRIHAVCALFYIILFILIKLIMKRRKLNKECRFISFDNFVEYAVEKRLGLHTKKLSKKTEKVVDFTRHNIEDCILRFPQESNQQVDLTVNFTNLNDSKLLPKLLLKILALNNTVIGEYVLQLDIPGEKPEENPVVNTSKKANSREHLQQENTKFNYKKCFIRDSVSTDRDDFATTHPHKESCTQMIDESSQTNRNVFISQNDVDYEINPIDEIETNFHKVQDDIVEYSHALDKSEIEERTQWFNNQISKLKENLVESQIEDTNLEEKPLKPTKHNKTILVQSRSNRAEFLRRMSRKGVPAENIENVKELKPKQGENPRMRRHSLNPKYFNLKYEKERRKALTRIAQYNKRTMQRTSKNNDKTHNESINKQVTKNFHVVDMPSENIETNIDDGTNKPQKPNLKKPFVKYRIGPVRMKNLRVAKDTIESDGGSNLPKICTNFRDTTIPEKLSEYEELKNKDTKVPKLPEYEKSSTIQSVPISLDSTKTEQQLIGDLKKSSHNSEQMPVSNLTPYSSIKMNKPFIKPLSRIPGGGTSFADETLSRASIEFTQTAKSIGEDKFSKTRSSSFIVHTKKSEPSLVQKKIKQQSIRKRTSCSNLIASTKSTKDSVCCGIEILPKRKQTTKETPIEEFSKTKSFSCVLDTQNSEQKSLSDGSQKFRFQSFSNTSTVGMKKESSLPKIAVKYNKSHSTIELEKNCLKSAMSGLQMKNEPLFRSKSNIERSYKQSLLFTMTDKQRAQNEMQDKFMPPKKVVKVVNKLVPTNLVNELEELPKVGNGESYLTESQLNTTNQQLEEDEQFSMFTINNNIDSLTRKNKKIEKIIQTKKTDPECETKPTNVENFNEQDITMLNIELYSRPQGGNDILDTNSVQKKAN